MPQTSMFMPARLCIVVQLLASSLALAAVPAVTATGDSLTIRAGETELKVWPPELRPFETTVPVPGDHAQHFELWDPWPTGTKAAPMAVSISPKKDEQGTLVLGGLFRSVPADSVVVTSGDGSKTYEQGVDYRVEQDWPQIAAISGRLGKPGVDQLKVRLQYATQRIDLVQIDNQGRISMKQGTPRMVCPQIPETDPGLTPVAGVYVAPWQRNGKYVVQQEDIFPIEKVEPVAPVNPEATQRARQRLSTQQPLTIAFLGDSVTLGAEAGNWWEGLWTDQNRAYVSRVVVDLRKRFPGSTITPIHAAKGATTTKAAARMFDELVAPAKPHLVMIAFGLNDAAGAVSKPPQNPPESYKEDVRALVKKSKDAGAEVILITPMQPNPWLRNELAERIKAYRAVLLELSQEEQVGCADVHTAWLNQAAEGVPPFSQLHNWINHPGAEGHAAYAETILPFLAAPSPAGGATTGEAAAAPVDPRAQPTVIPGQWAFGGDADTPPMPELSSILAAAKPNDRIYGLYVWPGEYASHLEEIRRVGWRSFRSGGVIDDAAMRTFAQDDIELLYTVGVSSDLRPRLANDPAAVEQLLVEYPKKLQEILGRYGPGGSFFAEHPDVANRPLRHIEITNEPNFQYMIPPDGRPHLEMEKLREGVYARLLPAAYRGVKEKHPDVTVVGFGAGGAGAGDLRFVANVHTENAAVADSMDVLSTHPYVDPAPPEAYAIRSWGRYSISGGLVTLRKTLEQFDADRKTPLPIWYTEIGWPISKADGGRFESKGDRISPILQAAYACRLYAYAQRLGVERVHMMFATDTDNFNAGFFLHDRSWRPSAFAVCNMIRLMPRPKLVEAISDGKDGVFAYRFESGDAANSPVVMAWRVSGTSWLSIPVNAAQAVVTDMLGAEQRRSVADGAVEVEVGPLPTYVSPAVARGD